MPEKIIYSIIGLILFFGCSLPLQKITAPSQTYYYQANQLMENKDYSQAIEKYQIFLKKNPSSSLYVPAKLNLAMSYYYSGKLKEAEETLKTIKIEDPAIKTFIEGILNKCAQQTKTVDQPQETQAGKINIEIIETSVDDLGTLTIKGKTNQPAAVYINNALAQTSENNQFNLNLPWKKSNAIILLAKDALGNSGTREYYPDSEPPQKPSGLSVINTSSNSAQIEWEANQENDINGYKLYYQLKGSSRQEIPDLISKTHYEIIGLYNLSTPTNKTFQIYLRAVDKMNNYSDTSDILEITLP
jgi:tetratricopeptide (TPR) repeat protein